MNITQLQKRRPQTSQATMTTYGARRITGQDYLDGGDDVLTDHTSTIQDSSKASHLLQSGIRGKR